MSSDRGVHQDGLGDDFESVDEAAKMCRQLLPDLLHAGLPDGNHHVVTCDVRDAAGQIVYRGRLTFDGASGPA